MKLVIVQRIFSHYRKPIFDKIADSFDLRLIHAKNKSEIKQAESNYSINVSSWHFGKKETNQFLWLFPQLFKFKPKVLIHEMALGMPSMFFTLWLRKLLGLKFILWGHGYDRKIGFNPSNNWSDKIRLYLMKNADAVLLYDEQTKKLLSQYLNKTKLFVAPNTLDTNELISIRTELEKKGRLRICKELNWTKKYNLVYIGRLLESKYPEKLFEVFKYFPKEIQENLNIHIIGSGPEEEKLKALAKKLPSPNNFIFYGAIHDARLSGKMLYAADLMVIPGAVGLSVNHAFAFDCPVATFQKTADGPHHGPEIEYVLPNKTGIVAPVFNSNKLADDIFYYLKSAENQSFMRNEVRSLLETKASISQMVQGFKSVISYTNSKPNE
jgi:glycosyltransferase involved in cell wall biosynthesis